jgi:hypothetical protein
MITKLINTLPLVRLPLEPDQLLEISEIERSTRERLPSSTLQEATPEEEDREMISAESFSFCDGLIRAPVRLTSETTGDSEGKTRTRTDTLAMREELWSWTVIVISWTVLRELLLDLKASRRETLTTADDNEDTELT